MSTLPAGYYTIVNKVPDNFGYLLAMTFTGGVGDVIATPLIDNQPTPGQVWLVTDYDGETQTVSPKEMSNLQIAKGHTVLTVLDAYSYIWIIREAEGGFTVQDSTGNVFWELKGVINEPVSYGVETGSDKQIWRFTSIRA